MKPRRACVGANDRDAVGMAEKFFQPRHMSIAPTKRMVQDHQPRGKPELLQAVLFDGEALLCRHPTLVETGRSNVHVEDEAELLEVLLWRAPVRDRADARLVLSHDETSEVD